ncbi:MAG: PorT family protein, partial [Hymenobacteraceae bacterium]|nr:PorT family protein [Hymenobacteraceae bacterium]
MKKLLLIALLLTSAAFTSKAQIKAGIKGGGSVSTLHYSDYKNIDSFLKADFYAGVHTSVKLFGNLHAQPELLYSKKGFEGKELESFKVDLEYITLPLLLKYEFYERVSVLGGIEVGALAKAIQ